jgi:hypothetical protein
VVARIWAWIAVGAVGLVIVSTVLPLLRTTRWWVRILDFPRFQIALLALLVVLLLSASVWPPRGTNAIFLLCVLASASWQLSWIWRYLPGAPLEVQTPNGIQRSELRKFSDG